MLFRSVSQSRYKSYEVGKRHDLEFITCFDEKGILNDYCGDTAIMVHPEDERYKAIVGKEVILPLTDRKIKVITDSHVDMEFGTGVVKVTPAHDTNDYEVGKRHDLEFITCFDEKGILNDYCGEFAGLERLEARKPIVEKLEKEGFIVKIEDHNHQVGHCYRCKNIVEPYISKQWFVRKEVAAESIRKTYAGEAKFHPSHWLNSYRAWMDELRDWCISRQLWWGHRIPVFHCDYRDWETDRKSTRLNSSHITRSRMPSSA